MTDQQRLRSFIAIPLSAQNKQQIARLQQQLQDQLANLKTPAAESLHLTLHFLGDLTLQQLAEISQLVLSIGQKKKIFNVSLQGLGCFPNHRKPRILWLGIKPEAKVIELHQELADGLRRIGLEIDQRQYRPHLTIGRFRQQPVSTSPLCPFMTQSYGSLKIDRVVLYTSELLPSGAIHRVRTAAWFGTKDNS